MDKPLQVLFKGYALKTIKRLQEHSGVKNRGDVVRDALKLYDEIDRIAPINGEVVIGTKTTRKLLTLPRNKKKNKNYLF